MRLAIVGLGHAGQQVMRAVAQTEHVDLVAVADPREAVRTEFEPRGIRVYQELGALLEKEMLDVLWVASPNVHHCEHVIQGAAAGLNVICEKPMAITVEECDRMIAAANAQNVRLMLVSKIFDVPVQAMKSTLISNDLGAVRSLTLQVHTNWLRRPRAAHDLLRSLGGGVVFRQAPHMVDIARYLLGSDVEAVTARVGREQHREGQPDGDFDAFLRFSNGGSATLSMNGYGFFDSSELTWGFGETGQFRTPSVSTWGKATEPNDVTGAHLSYYGQLIVGCENGTIRQSPRGLAVYLNNRVVEVLLNPRERCVGELLEMKQALDSHRPAFPDGDWGRTTLRVCETIIRSSEAAATLTI